MNVNEYLSHGAADRNLDRMRDRRSPYVYV